MDIDKIYKFYSKNYLVDTDSRKIRKDAIFFALKGENFNGNLYALQALEKGASYAVVDEYISDDKRLILVEDVLTSLQKLASYHRDQLNIPILALTGSNGKTTTKELINIVLEKKYKTKATYGNLNNHIGVPLTLLSIDDKVEFGIIEMGANHHKEIEFLSRIVKPDFGYITNFGKAHLEGFGSLEGVVEAKSELYENIIENNKIVFVNSEDSKQMSKTTNANRILLNTNVSILESSSYLTLDYDKSVIKTSLVGDYNLTNIRAAITIGEYFNVKKTYIIEALTSYEATNNRSQVVKTNKNEIILDAYNANPTSMEAAIINFSRFESDEKTIVLGDMFELGEVSMQEHQILVEIIAKYDFDSVFLIGENFYKTTSTFFKFKSFNDFSDYFKQINFKDNKFLIKGSRGMKLERVIDLID